MKTEKRRKRKKKKTVYTEMAPKKCTFFSEAI